MADIRRDRIDMMFDLLKVARQPVIKTRLVYGANTNFGNIMDYLDELQEGGYIEKEGTRYHTTPLGKECLNKYQDIMETLDLKNMPVRAW